jgi:hypothetical protein
MESDSLDRREFTVQSALALLGGVTITITGCGGGGYSSRSPSGGTSSSNVFGTISDNHGHQAVITSAQLTTGGGLSLDIRGQADHPHAVDLTAAEVSQIRNGQTVAKASTNTASASYAMHGHVVTFSRSNAPDGPGY